MKTASPPSKSAINKAGKLLRKHHQRGIAAGFDVVQIGEAREIVLAWRSLHQRPTTGVNMGLRSFINTEGCSGPTPGQRLKRLPQIVAKLARHPNMALSTMQDVGGCRAILGSQAEVERVRRRIHKRWEVVGDDDDYVSNPQPTGYRAIHTVVLRHGRRVEIQLRTPAQHNWAEAVERLGRRWRLPLKDGQGPEDLLEYLAVAADLMNMEEIGIPLEEEVERRFYALRASDTVSRYLLPPR